MSKHEEMIENVHRRIAQYEEEKKMKHFNFKNIFSTTKPDSKIETNIPDEDGYIEVVSGTERIKSSKRTLRIVSSVAACSVLAASIGTTGVLLNKNKGNKAAPSEENVVTTESTETGTQTTVYNDNVVYTNVSVKATETTVSKEGTVTTEATETATVTTLYAENVVATQANEEVIEEATEAATEEVIEEATEAVTEKTTEPTVTKKAENVTISQYIDFTKKYFRIHRLNNYSDFACSDATYDSFAAYLNNFKWGKGTAISEKELPDFDKFGGQGYTINWRKGDVWYYINITDSGKAYFHMEKCIPLGGPFEYQTSGCAVFNIDYKAFDNGINNIWSKNVPDTSEYLSKQERMYLTQGEFQVATVTRYGSSSSGEFVPNSAKSKEALQGFLKENFVGMLKNEMPDTEYVEGESYEVECYYKTSDTTTRRLTYFIGSNGSVAMCEYELTADSSIPTGCPNYSIDINAFKNVLKDIENGKYNNKY